jgi:hypothetical protein
MSTFCSTHRQHPFERVRSPIGEPAIIEEFNPHGYRASINGLCRNTPGMAPFFYNAVDKSTSGDDMIDFILEAIRQRFLVAGDILVMDNAPSHVEVQDNLRGFLQLAGIRLLFLPK